MPKLNQNQLFDFDPAYPSRDQQHRIVAYLDSLQAEIERLKRLQADCAAELDALLLSLLDQAFRGEL